MQRFFILTIWLGLAGPIYAGDKRVSIHKTPGHGIQPQAVLDEKGKLHLLYFLGEAKGGNLMYVQRDAGTTGFSHPLRVNSQEGSSDSSWKAAYIGPFIAQSVIAGVR